MADEVKLAVLEQKFADFVNIVNRLDDAIDKLSEVSSNVVKMLAVHEERIEQALKANDVLIRLIEQAKRDNDIEHKNTHERVDVLEMKLEEVRKVKWMTIGIGVFGAVLATAIGSFASGAFQNFHPLSQPEVTRSR
jgi:hypothetical protein